VDLAVLQLRLAAGEPLPFWQEALAKLVVHGADRRQAIARARAAVDATQNEGLETDLAVHALVLDDPGFQRGEVTIGSLGALMQRHRGH
jgi:acetyl-CoA carboxylase biotin carboxylase subunit